MHFLTMDRRLVRRTLAPLLRDIIAADAFSFS
jgi:hypothetical protein